MMDISNSTEKLSQIRDHQKIQSVDQAKVRGARSANRQQATDEVALSEQAQLLAKLSQAVDDSPDVREKKVAEIREAVQQKKYEISYSEIAKAILASRGK